MLLYSAIVSLLAILLFVVEFCCANSSRDIRKRNEYQAISTDENQVEENATAYNYNDSESRSFPLSYHDSDAYVEITRNITPSSIYSSIS